MKKLLLLWCFGMLAIPNYAQFITIPDTAFVTWLQTHGLDSCMQGNQLDTTCPALFSFSEINCSDVPVQNLTGIQYFKNLTVLGCNNDNLTFIPAFPPRLTLISCDNNNLHQLPSLPVGLQNFDCSVNPITSLPSLPASLYFLTCTQDSLTSLPSLPDSLRWLFCGYNPLLHSLPTLPAGLTSLNCLNDALTSLPELPDSLYSFSCVGNPDLTCMPILKRIVTLWFENTGINCVPNYGNVTNSYPSLNTVALCTAGNPNACAVSTSIDELSENKVTLKIYPNPAIDILHIQSIAPNGMFRLTDMTGKTWAVSVIENELDISSLAPGIYCLHVQTVTSSIGQTFIKE